MRPVNPCGTGGNGGDAAADVLQAGNVNGTAGDNAANIPGTQAPGGAGGIFSFNGRTYRGGADSLSTDATSSSVVGAYTITPTQGSLWASNYTFDFTPGTLTVTQATPTVTAINDSETYTGSPLAYPDSDVTVTGANGLSNSDGELSYTYNGSATVPTAAGAYSVVITFTPTDATDFTTGTQTATWTINPYAFTYTINGDNQAYGSAANLAADLPATFDTGVNGENLAITYTSAGDTNTASVGTYAITGSVSDGTGSASSP